MAEAYQIQSGFAKVNGTKLYYEVAGEGHPLVLIHGGLVDRRLWDEQFLTFAQRYKVIRYDMRGFGDSALVKADTQPYSMRDDLYYLLQFLGVAKAYVIGLSMGGSLAVDFTLEHPEIVEALIPVGAGLSGFEAKIDKEKFETLQAKIDAAFKEGDIPRAAEIMTRLWTDGPRRSPEQVDADVRARIKAMTIHNFERPDDETAPRPLPLDPPAAKRLAEIAVPTLVIVGAEDIPSIFETADVLAAQIKGAKKAVIPDGAHHPNMEQPAEFNRIVLDFLETVPATR